MSQVLDGLLRRYVKGIQKEQLKIGIWKGQSSIPSPSALSSAAFAQPRANCNSCLSCYRSISFGILWLRAVLLSFGLVISVVLLPDQCSFWVLCVSLCIVKCHGYFGFPLLLDVMLWFELLSNYS